MTSRTEQQIFLPRISNQMENCKLIEWSNEEGDYIAAGEWLEGTKPVGIITINK